MWTNATFATLVGKLLSIIEILVLVVFALSLLVFVWKVIDTWIINGGAPDKVKAGKTAIITSIIVFVVMASVWGIVALLRTVIGP